MRNPLVDRFAVPFFLGMVCMAAAFVFLFVMTEPLRHSVQAKQACTQAGR